MSVDIELQSAAELVAFHCKYETSSVEKTNDILKKELIRNYDPYVALLRVVLLNTKMNENKLSKCESASVEYVPRIKTKLNKQSIVNEA